MKKKNISVVLIMMIAFSILSISQYPAFSETQRDYDNSGLPISLAAPQYESIYEDSPFAIHGVRFYNQDADEGELIQGLGARMARIEPIGSLVWDAIEIEIGVYDWVKSDFVMSEGLKAGVKIFGTVVPANKLYGAVEGEPIGLPDDMGAYLLFLKKAVERYDGDGIDDAPGSPRIDVIQIYNEIDGKHSWNDTPENYALLLQKSYVAIKEADPTMKVAIAGVASPRGYYDFYRLIFEELAKISPNQKCFDIFDLHWHGVTEGDNDYAVKHYSYGDYYLRDVISDIKADLSILNYSDVNLVITEMSDYSDSPASGNNLTFPYHTEVYHASSVIKRFVYSLASDVDKIFWAQIIEHHNFGEEVNGYFDNVALINNPKNTDGYSHKKLAYYTYKKMVEILEGSDWDNIEIIQESDNVYIYKFIKDDKPVWVAWNDNEYSQTVSLSDLGITSAKVTETIPNFNDGLEIVNSGADYNDPDFFNSYTASNDITLGDVPVFIEEWGGTSGYEDSPFGFHTAVPYEDANYIGAEWTRGGSAPYIFWSHVDPNKTGDQNQFQWQGETAKGYFNYDNLNFAKDAGLNQMHNIDVQPAQVSGYRKADSWLPVDEEAYINFVKAAIKRYPFIRYWQIGNEPVARKSDYGRFLSITYDAIKDADEELRQIDPDLAESKVFIGGVAGLHSPRSISEYKETFNVSYLPLLEDVAEQGVRCFDIFDFHWYGDAVDYYKMTRDIYEYISEKIDELGIPSPEEYWITEMGTYSGDPKAISRGGNTGIDWGYQSEKQQAQDLVKRYIYPLSSGIKKVFMAWGLKEGFHYDEGYFDFTGLIYDGVFDPVYIEDGDKKLGYYTYKKMTEILEGSDWDNIETVQEEGDVYIYKLLKDGKPIYVAWNDSGIEKNITISDINTNAVKITEAVPHYALGIDVVNYDDAFSIGTNSVSNGQVDITLGDVPIFIEALSPEDDTTGPTTPVVTDEGATTSSTAQLYGQWQSEDPESGITEYQYRITKDSSQGAIIRDWTSTGEYNYVTAAVNLEQGTTYYFSVKAINGAGLESIGYSDGITVNYNFFVSITSPENDSYVSGRVKVEAEAYAGDIGIDEVEFFVDGGSIGTDSSDPYYRNFYTSDFALDSTHTIKIIAYDEEGNTATDSVSVTVDNEDPEISGMEATLRENSSCEISWTTDEPVTSRLTYGEASSMDNALEDDALKTEHSFTIDGLTQGTKYYYKAYATDRAG
ncbi:MAG TPA: hypothetical protein ENH41_04990, partial [Candidatus Omnitrophica bacterium]|nr:hypothetical protein [Candidatus Omnitrophota bacterium]